MVELLAFQSLPASRPCQSLRVSATPSTGRLVGGAGCVRRPLQAVNASALPLQAGLAGACIACSRRRTYGVSRQWSRRPGRADTAGSPPATIERAPLHQEPEHAAELVEHGAAGRKPGAVSMASLSVPILVCALMVAGGPADIQRAVMTFSAGLVQNHAPGVGGVIEDAYLGFLSLAVFYALYRSAVPRPVGNPIRRRSRTIQADIHVVTGALAMVAGEYGLLMERVYRESPGWGWMWFSVVVFLINSVTYSSLMAMFNSATEKTLMDRKSSTYLFRLAYSFVSSFQGLMLIHWSHRADAPEWMYLAVLPFWFWSIAKLFESSTFVLGLCPKPEPQDASPWAAWVRYAQEQVGVLSVQDPAVVIVTACNVGAALFDNVYVGLFTWLGPEAFWHTSASFNPNDYHLSLVKPAIGSLSVATGIFVGTVGFRRQMPGELAFGTTILLASVGPWVVLLWHKLLAPGEMWFPQLTFDPAFNYDWGSPFFMRQLANLFGGQGG